MNISWNYLQYEIINIIIYNILSPNTSTIFPCSLLVSQKDKHYLLHYKTRTLGFLM